MHTSITTQYWVVADDGTIPDAGRIEGLTGAAAATTDGAVAVETPPCETLGTLRTTLIERLRTIVEAAHEIECRVVPLGVRPDVLHDSTAASAERPPPIADSRICFETEPDRALDLYNVLLALDPAFALVNTVACRDGEESYACGRQLLCRRQTGLSHRRRQQLYAYAESTDTWAETLGEAVEVGGPSALGRARDERRAADSRSADPAHWTPVTCSDDRTTVTWNSPDATTPTLLLQLIADAEAVLRQAATCTIDVEGFGNGCYADRIVLPDAEWLSIYQSEALSAGTDSLVLRAYLERFGFDSTWYRQASPTPTIGSLTEAEATAYCRRRSVELEEELGLLVAS